LKIFRTYSIFFTKIWTGMWKITLCPWCMCCIYCTWKFMFDFYWVWGLRCAEKFW